MLVFVNKTMLKYLCEELLRPNQQIQRKNNEEDFN